MIFDDASFRFLNNNNKKTANLFIKLFISVLFVNYKFFFLNLISHATITKKKKLLLSYFICLFFQIKKLH